VDGKLGYWLITARGAQFLRGEIAAPQRVKTFRNKVLNHSREMIHILQLKGKLPEFEKERLRVPEDGSSGRNKTTTIIPMNESFMSRRG
jgi:hypothetical protein